jgi:hypothetical protein
MKKIILLGFLISGAVLAGEQGFIPCSKDSIRLQARSLELAKIVSDDQSDRKDWQSLTIPQMLEVAKRDLTRRKRVGEIFGEGCFVSSKDFAAAALVFQHGDTPEHFYQTFIWAKRAVDLGDSSQKTLMALGVDRYLVNIGQKQLFGSQAYQPQGQICYCLNTVEKTFPESLRVQYSRPLNDIYTWLAELNKGHNCNANVECNDHLKDTPAGSVPGFW